MKIKFQVVLFDKYVSDLKRNLKKDLKCKPVTIHFYFLKLITNRVLPKVYYNIIFLTNNNI
jgi:hypothetical protein